MAGGSFLILAPRDSLIWSPAPTIKLRSTTGGNVEAHSSPLQQGPGIPKMITFMRRSSRMVLFLVGHKYRREITLRETNDLSRNRSV